MDRYAFNQDWYAIKYSLAALKANEWVCRRRLERDGNGEPADPAARTQADAALEGLRAAAFSHATDAAITSCTTLADLERSSWTHPLAAWARSRASSTQHRRELCTFLSEAMLPSALVLLAGVTAGREDLRPVGHGGVELLTVLREGRADPDSLVAWVAARPRRAARVDYNLACYYAERGDSDGALARLRASLIATPFTKRAGLAERASEDPTLAQALAAIPSNPHSGAAILEWAGIEAGTT